LDGTTVDIVPATLRSPFRGFARSALSIKQSVLGEPKNHNVYFAQKLGNAYRLAIPAHETGSINTYWQDNWIQQ
jgi:hypothetical protein